MVGEMGLGVGQHCGFHPTSLPRLYYSRYPALGHRRLSSFIVRPFSRSPPVIGCRLNALSTLLGSFSTVIGAAGSFVHFLPVGHENLRYLIGIWHNFITKIIFASMPLPSTLFTCSESNFPPPHSRHCTNYVILSGLTIQTACLFGSVCLFFVFSFEYLD